MEGELDSGWRSLLDNVGEDVAEHICNKVFENHIEASIESKLPLIIHQRSSEDEIIDVLDTVRMVSIIMGDYTPNTLESLLADINQDGQINVQDVVLIVNIILSD